MTKKLYLLFFLALLMLQTPAQAQLVDIPNAKFRARLQAIYPACFVGDQIDPTCSAITSETTLDVSSQGIADLSGIGYFTSLKKLYCENNNLTSLPALPGALTDLYCNSNNLTSLPTLPNGLINLRCADNLLDFTDLEAINSQPGGYYADPKAIRFYQLPKHLVLVVALSSMAPLAAPLINISGIKMVP